MHLNRFLLFFIIIISILSVPTVRATDYTLEESRTDGSSTDNYFVGGGATHMSGFCWKASDTYTLGKIQLYIIKDTPCNGYLNVRIYASDVNKKPTGSPLYTWNSTINAGWSGYTDFICASSVSIAKDSYYNVEIWKSGATGNIGTQYGSTAGETGWYTLDGSTWNTQTRKHNYKVYSQIWNTSPNAPVGNIQDMDDTDNLYAMKKYYSLSVNATDTDGYTDISSVVVRIRQGGVDRVVFKYLTSGTAFSIVSGTNWYLNTTTSTHSGSGNNLYLKFMVEPKWNATEESDLAIIGNVTDSTGGFNLATMQDDYFDVVTTLRLSSLSTNPTPYVTTSSAVTFSGQIYYVNNPASTTCSTSYPPNNRFTSVAIHKRDNTLIDTTSTITNGAFSKATTSSSIEEYNTYHIYLNMLDASYTDGDLAGATVLLRTTEITTVTYEGDFTVIYGWTNHIGEDVEYIAKMWLLPNATVTGASGGANYTNPNIIYVEGDITEYYAWDIYMGNPEVMNITGVSSTAHMSEKGLTLAYSFPNPPQLLNITINNVNMNATGNAGYWIFKSEPYTLKMYVQNTEDANITMTDSVHQIKFCFDNSTRKQWLEVTGYPDVNMNLNVMGIQYVTHQYYASNITMIQWNFIASENIIDSYNQTLSYSLESTVGITSGSCNTLLNIYNLGGKVYYENVGDGHHIVGGDSFEVGATAPNNSSKAIAVYRRLQHWHTMIEIATNSDLDGDALENFASGGQVTLEIDYMLNNSWVEGWKCIITPVDNNVGTNGAGTDTAWVNLAIGWYNRGVLIKTDYIMSYDWAYDKDKFPTDRNSFNLWTDLWFNKMNSSSVVGGRVNAVYHGMYEAGSSWWFGYGGFRPMIGNTTASMCFVDLKDVNSTIISCMPINLVRISCELKKLNKTETNDDEWQIKPFQIFDVTLAGDRMKGVDTPIFNEPKIMQIEPNSFLAPLFMAISGIGNAIWGSAIGFMRVTISGIDGLLMIFGVPYGTFSNIVNMVVTILTQMLGYFNIILIQLQNLFSIIAILVTNLTVIVNYTVGMILWFLFNIFAIPFQIIYLFETALNGGIIVYYGITLDFTPYASLMAGIKQIAPLTVGIMFVSWIFYGNIALGGEPDMERMPSRFFSMFKSLKDVLESLFYIYKLIRAWIMYAIQTVKGWIPFLGGSPQEPDV